MDNYNLRMMQISDVDAVVALIERNEPDDAPLARQFFKRFFEKYETEHEYARHYILEENHNIVAVGGWENKDPETMDVFWIGWMFVDPYYQGHGLGSRLLGQVERDVTAKNGRKLYVEVSAADMENQANRFFLRHDYTREGTLKDYYKKGADLYIYGKDL